MNRPYAVQSNLAGLWLPCGREDIELFFLERIATGKRQPGRTAPPYDEVPARFHTHAAADRFIARCRGFLHCGGTDIVFRVVHELNFAVTYRLLHLHVTDPHLVDMFEGTTSTVYVPASTVYTARVMARERLASLADIEILNVIPTEGGN